MARVSVVLPEEPFRYPQMCARCGLPSTRTARMLPSDLSPEVPFCERCGKREQLWRMLELYVVLGLGFAEAAILVRTGGFSRRIQLLSGTVLPLAFLFLRPGREVRYSRDRRAKTIELSFKNFEFANAFLGLNPQARRVS